MSCDRLMEWLALLQDDSDSLDFIKATSKPCFHCGTFTERISGCNHMVSYSGPLFLYCFYSIRYVGEGLAAVAANGVGCVGVIGPPMAPTLEDSILVISI